MEISKPLPEDDVLAEPIRARLFSALTDLRRPASTQELAQLAGRHPNTVRVQLQRLAEAGLIECRQQRQTRGRPRHSWAVLPDARPGGNAPEAHGQLSRWLARAIVRSHELAAVEAAGREIGQELAPQSTGRSVRAAMQDALTTLGFAPHDEPSGDGGTSYVLRNCPYREAVAENPAVVCTLHRGITQGLLDRLSPQTRLKSFVARDPSQAGCLIEITAR